MEKLTYLKLKGKAITRQLNPNLSSKDWVGDFIWSLST